MIAGFTGLDIKQIEKLKEHSKSVLHPDINNSEVYVQGDSSQDLAGNIANHEAEASA